MIDDHCVTVTIARPAHPQRRSFQSGDLAGAAEYRVRPGVGAYGEIGQRPAMSQQPELTSPPITTPPPAGAVIPQGPVAIPDTAQPLHHGPQRIPRWLERAELFLRVLLRMYIGLAVCYAPWSKLFWDQNPLFVRYPTVSLWASHGAIRGIISGLGLLNLWIAFREAVRHRDG